MNVNTFNNVAMMSQMVGLPQQVGTGQELNRTLDIDEQVPDLEKGEKSPEAKTPQKSPEATNSARQHAKGVERRYVAEEDNSEQGPQGKAAGEGSPQEKSPPKLDRSNQIQFKFNSALNSNQQAMPGAPSMQQRSRQMVENLSRWVETEYRQFSKAPDNYYSRKDLRQIISMLKDNKASQSKSKAAGSRNKDDEPAYNNGNITKLTTVMRAFEDLPRESLDEIYL
ncbi:MAG: hypothetical protein RDV48_23355 [Candidatus Eremiobacteraeota bacterium]|nr:hypothetical protein [Candidatus Eremiobacteraeota bacterium]